MKQTTLVFLFLCLGSTFACQSSSQSASSVMNEEQKEPKPAIQERAPNDRWVQAWNSRSDDLSALYTENAIRLTASGATVNGQVAITENSQAKSFQIDSIQTIQSVFANSSESYSYEIGTFWTDEPAQYRQLVIWKNEPSGPLRELEMLIQTAPSSDLAPIIDARRADWIKQCNAHNAERLVHELYAEQALYYNHKPMVIGRAAITQEYQYMNRPQYQLHLEPIILEIVTPDMAFEIGQCSGSYGGKYVIVWQKATDGQWYVMMDSNI